MEVIVVKYVQLVCLTLLMSNDGNCAQLMSQTEESNNNKVSACTADCLKNEIETVSFIKNIQITA
jgi:hypothetical protein